jgi:N-acyl-D-amino-acid deacylase
MAAYDQAIPELMKKYAIPGGAVAVLRDGKLIYARGFGYADVENKTPVKPDALFRIASVSKPITSVAIMKLVEDGKLKLDDRVAPFIAHLAPAPGAAVDPRWEEITIRHLLNHTGGWDRDRPNGGFDPMFRPAIAAAAVGAPAPASAETVIRYMRGMPLDFNPGEKFVYSNFGYAILGRVIERLSGMPYEEFVRTRVLQPVGANRTRLGKTRMGATLADEVKYYLPGEPGLGLAAPLVPSVFPGEGTVPVNYGGFYVEAMDSHGGWVASTVDLLRFVAGVDGRASRPDILSASLVAEMTSGGPPLCGGACHYSGGWLVRPTQGDATWSHGGSLPGTFTMLVRTYHNFSWVALFNARAATSFDTELDAALWKAVGGVTTFPAHDLFSAFP